MMPAAESQPQPGGLIEFQIIPLETIRAIVAIFIRTSKTCATLNLLSGHDLENTKQQLESLLDKGTTSWPLNVKIGSSLWLLISKGTLLARAYLASLPYYYPSHEVKYLVSLPTFFEESVEVSGRGVLESSEVITLCQPHKGLQRRAGTVNGRTYEDGDLTTEDSHEFFERIKAAAQFKSEMCPHESSRTQEWLRLREAVLPAFINGFGGILTVDMEKERSTKLAVCAKKDELTQYNLVRRPINDSAATPSSSGSTMDDYFHVPPTQASTPSKLELTCTATLQHDNKTTSIPIDPNDFETEKLTLEATQKMWSCMVQGGVPADTIDIRGLLRAVRGMVYKSDDPLAEALEIV